MPAPCIRFPKTAARPAGLARSHPLWRGFIGAFLAVAAVALAAIAPGPLQAQQALAEKNPAPVKTQKTTAESDQKNRKKLDAALEEKLRRLDNLYTPIHWSDPANGLAIGGFDPISYFEAGRAIEGNNDHQKAWHGVGWRFQSEGNLILFAASPSVYAPRFAGYDPYAISNGIAAAGKPTIWEIINGRLYLFHNEVNRYLWHENHKKLAAVTHAKWAELSTDLPQYKVIARKDRQLDFGDGKR